MYHIFGHRFPDTDAIASAYALQAYFTAQNLPAQAYQLGDANLESRFVLDFVGLDELPRLDPDNPLSVLTPNDWICLTDHNEVAQSINQLSLFDIRYVIDHHKIALNTPTPAYVRIYPVGCTCTILFEMFNQKDLPISKPIATLMAAAIISDTLNLNSPTTTTEDENALHTLARLTQLDIKTLAKDMFAAKSRLEHINPNELLLMDYKTYQFVQDTWGIAVIETTNPDTLLTQLPALNQTARTIKHTRQLSYFMVAIVDILTQNSFVLDFDDKLNTFIHDSFNQADQQLGYIHLDGVVSRKSQIVPVIERRYQILHPNQEQD